MGQDNDVDFHDALKASYGNSEAKHNIEQKGYRYDKDLSNDNQQIYYNPKSGKMLNTIAGTHNLKDWGTDLYLGLGHLQDTNRYKEAEKTLEKAKQKYHPSKTVIAGHSLGSSIGQTLSSKADRTVTLDGGYTIGQKTRGESYRASGDVVSALGSNATHQKTIKGSLIGDHKYALMGSVFGLGGMAIGAGVDALTSHNVDKVKDKKIYI
jgi:hypothetical protein